MSTHSKIIPFEYSEKSLLRRKNIAIVIPVGIIEIKKQRNFVPAKGASIEGK